jgi:hypothetical protein
VKINWRTCGHAGFLLLLLTSGAVLGQEQKHVDAVNVTFCDLYSEPQKFAGKMIMVRAILYGYRDPILESTGTKDESCMSYMTIGLVLPQDLKPSPDFIALKDESFQTFEHAWQHGMRIMATFEGRFDPVFVWRDHKRVRVGQGQGFGRKHLEDGRIILRRVSDISAFPVPNK